jgi:hypothetical protein
MAPTPDGAAVYVADYPRGLFRVDAQSGEVTPVADVPGSPARGLDGLAWDGGAIVAVQNGIAPPRVMRFVLDSAGRRVVRAEVLDQRADLAPEPTIGTIVGGAFVYVANSQWDEHDDAGAVKPGARLTRPVLVSVALPK